MGRVGVVTCEVSGRRIVTKQNCQETSWAAARPISVLVTLRWMTSDSTEVLAQAVAWTRTEVEVEWVFHGHTR